MQNPMTKLGCKGQAHIKKMPPFLLPLWSVAGTILLDSENSHDNHANDIRQS